MSPSHPTIPQPHPLMVRHLELRCCYKEPRTTSRELSVKRHRGWRLSQLYPLTRLLHLFLFNVAVLALHHGTVDTLTNLYSQPLALYIEY